jgi:hypothetical protein
LGLKTASSMVKPEDRLIIAYSPARVKLPYLQRASVDGDGEKIPDSEEIDSADKLFQVIIIAAEELTLDCCMSRALSNSASHLHQKT